MRPRSSSCSQCTFTSALCASKESSSRLHRLSMEWTFRTSDGTTHFSQQNASLISNKTADRQCNNTKSPILMEWKDLPAWRQEGSIHIQTSYRRDADSLLDCYKSWIYIHNESVNIYSHVLGSILFACLPIWLFAAEIAPRYQTATVADLTVFLLYFFGVSVCFVFSATFHTVLNHSHGLARFGAQLDFQGILLLMWSATVAMIYYGFYCDPWLQRSYWTLHSSFAVACSILTFRPHFRDPDFGHFRALSFGSFGLSTMLPVIHGVARYGWAVQANRTGIIWILLTLFFNTIGAAAYALKFPEKWWCRTFDLFGASHQILHIAVIVAGLTFTMALLQAFDYLHNFGGKTCTAFALYQD